mmetsp:Transcript_6376/g.17042  ORF Transcript_6376/g.17042 Transcript_6376/m.17042 type:complete len:274 (+) Transcript_6376:308-1129(+)
MLSLGLAVKVKCSRNKLIPRRHSEPARAICASHRVAHRLQVLGFGAVCAVNGGRLHPSRMNGDEGNATRVAVRCFFARCPALGKQHLPAFRVRIRHLAVKLSWCAFLRRRPPCCFLPPWKRYIIHPTGCHENDTRLPSRVQSVAQCRVELPRQQIRAAYEMHRERSFQAIFRLCTLVKQHSRAAHQRVDPIRFAAIHVTRDAHHVLLFSAVAHNNLHLRRILYVRLFQNLLSRRLRFVFTAAHHVHLALLRRQVRRNLLAHPAVCASHYIAPS